MTKPSTTRPGVRKALARFLLPLAPFLLLLIVIRVPWIAKRIAWVIPRDPAWSCTRPLFVDVDGDGALDLVGTVFRTDGDGERPIAYSGLDGRLLWKSKATDGMDQGDGRYLKLTLEAGRLRATVEEDEVWLDVADGTAVDAPADAAAEAERDAGADWPFPDRSKIQETGRWSVEPLTSGRRFAGIRRKVTEFDGFEREQELFPEDADVHASFGLVEGERPALVGYRPGGTTAEDREVWRLRLGGDDLRATSAIPGFAAIDCDAGAVCAAYYRGSNWRGGLGLSLIDLETGATHWDVRIQYADAFSGVTLTAERVYMATLDGLVVLDRTTGKELFRVADRR
ncbi:MAG: hypothetical protein AAGI22_08280 [Planctomycetota bacterium]